MGINKTNNLHITFNAEIQLSEAAHSGDEKTEHAVVKINCVDETSICV